MNEIQVRESPEAIIVRLDEARHALTVARNDFERLCVVDHARAVEAAAASLGRRDIQVEASILVQEAERAIAKANPPMSREEAGARRWKERVVRDDALIKPTKLRDIRRAHEGIEDEEFEEIVEQAKEEMQPLTRKALADIGKQKQGKAAREERDTKLSAQETLFPTSQLYTVLLDDPPWHTCLLK